MASGAPQARECLRVLYERHAASVLSFLRQLTEDVNLAEDILQECFLVASRHAGRFRSGSARPWLLSIAARRLRDRRRERARRERREKEVARPDRMGANDGAGTDLEWALGQLLPKERAVLDLRFGAGLGFGEVAQVLGISLRTAKSWSAAGLARLREVLVDEG